MMRGKINFEIRLVGTVALLILTDFEPVAFSRTLLSSPS